MNELNIPEIRIQFGWLLYENISTQLAKIFGDMEGAEQVRQRVHEYKQAWKPLEEKILTGMQESYGLEFYRPVIDVYVSPWLHAMSNPLLLNTRPNSDEQVDILTHELFHVLLTDNKTYPHNTPQLGILWDELLPEADKLTRNHVWVHAGLKFIYLDVLKEPQRLERDIRLSQQWPGYRDAWEIVEKEGYKELIEKFKARIPELVKS